MNLRLALSTGVVLALLVSGCSGSDHGEIAKARAELEAARAEATKAKVEADASRSELAKLKGAAPSEDLEAARDISKDFLVAVVAAKWDNARTCCSEAFLERVKKRFNGNSTHWVGTVLAEELSYMPPDIVGPQKLTPEEKQLQSSSFTKEKLAASLDEAFFEGDLKGPKRAAQFKLRVIKEKANGKWRVDFLQVSDTK